MSILNNLSIKFRVLFLTLVPLVSLLLFSYFKVESLTNQINELSSVDVNLQIGKKLFSNILTMDKIRLAALHKQAIKLDNERQSQWNSNNKFIEDTIPKLLALFNGNGKSNKINSFSGTIGEIKDMVNDVESYKINNIDNVVEWSEVSFDDLNFDAIGYLEKLHLHTDIPAVDQKMHVIIQLRWIMYYTLQENWFIQVMLNEDTNDYLDQLKDISIAQEVFIGRFLSLNATEAQIKVLLKTFQSKAFQESYKYKQEILEGDLQDRSNSDLAKIEEILSQRFSLMKGISSKIIEKTNTEISASVETMREKIYLFIGIIIALIFFIALIGVNLAMRIFKYLTTVITTLESIERDHDYSILIPTDGKDEFSVFSAKLNVLIAERKVNEDKMIHAKDLAEKANQAKSYFLANMSHEIRTPLNGILGMHQILLESKLTSSQKNHLDTIEQSSKTLLILINDILDISKIESGNLSISRSSSNIRETIFEVLSIVMPQAAEKKLLLEVNIEASLPARLNIDEQRIRQVTMNLLSNAIKFTQDGKVALDVSGETDGYNYALKIAISDTGIGISKEHQDKIFLPFEQEDGSITRKFGGTGLGLSISKQLINLMGGTINIHSEKGKGSCFYFVLDCEIIRQTRKYKIIPALQSSDIILITNGQDTAGAVQDECAYFGLDVNTEIDSLENFNDDGYNNKLFIYCQNKLETTKKELQELVEIYPNTPLLVVQSTIDEQFDFRNKVAGQVIVPLLGERFIELLTHVIEHKPTMEVDKVDKVNKADKTYKTDKTDKTDKVDKVDSTEEKIEDVYVLIVEDNLVNQQVASFFVKGLGYKYEIADNGLIALNKIKDGLRPNVILMDCMMPEMDGFTATKKIRKFERSFGIDKIPIIALTASVFDEDIKNCYQAGMDDYLAKPINKELLQSKLMAILVDGVVDEHK